MKCSLGISTFLEEISSLSHSIVFLSLFALITEEGFVMSPAILWNSAFKWYNFPFLLFLLFLFFSQLFVRPPQTTILPFCISLYWGWSWSWPPVQFSSFTQSCPTLCDPMDCSTPGLPFHHQLLEFTQTHVHWVDDAIQLSYPLLSPSPPALSLSQHQGLFQWVSSLHQVAKLLEFQLQHQSFQWIFKTDFL